MKQVAILVLLASLTLAGCAPLSTPTPTPTATPLQTPTPRPDPLPLSEAGPYFPGRRSYALVDTSRDDRPVEILLWYPAIKPEGYLGTLAPDAEPDLRGAPYPLIISSAKVAHVFAPHLISYGFVVAAVNRIDTYPKMNEEMIDQPLDLLFALDQVASRPPEGLEGLIDGEHAGAMGYSFDGYNTLAMSGARIDPEHYLAQCPTPDPTTQAILGKLSAFDCAPAAAWDEFAAHAGGAITTSDDGLWQPMTDARIRAVMPLAGEGWWLFGERGLAAVDRPTLIIAATQDELYPENVLIFKHLGVADKRLISFVGRGHMMIMDGDMVARMSHFVVAFFGYHLQGRQDLAEYFSEDFVAKYPDLAWGEYTGK